MHKNVHGCRIKIEFIYGFWELFEIRAYGKNGQFSPFFGLAGKAIDFKQIWASGFGLEGRPQKRYNTELLIGCCGDIEEHLTLIKYSC